jgi:PAS domain S-box-containing protein
MQSVYDAVVIADTAGRIVDGNDRAVEFFQFSQPELCAATIFDLVSGLTPALFATICAKLGQQQFTLLAAYGQRKDQSLFPVEIAPSHLHLGGEVYWSFFIRDITQRTQAEAALKESEQRFKAIFDNAADGILLADPQTRRLYLANRAMCAMLGYTGAELAAMQVQDIHPAEDWPVVQDQFEKQARGEIKTAENLPIKRKDGSVFYADVTVFFITLADKSYMAGMFRDITERKQAAEALLKTQVQLARAERLETAGSIAGHIAHDFNNLLMPLLIYPDFIKDHLPENSPARKDLQVIEKTARMIADINQQLLALSRRGYYEQTVLNVNEIIQDAIELLGRSSQFGGLTFNLNASRELSKISVTL